MGCFIFWQVTADFPTTMLNKIIPEVKKDHRSVTLWFTFSQVLPQKLGNATLGQKQRREKELGKQQQSSQQGKKICQPNNIFFPKEAKNILPVFSQEAFNSPAALSVWLRWHLNDKVRQFEVHHIKYSNGPPRNEKEEPMAVLLDALGFCIIFHKLNL